MLLKFTTAFFLILSISIISTSAQEKKSFLEKAIDGLNSVSSALEGQNSGSPDLIYGTLKGSWAEGFAGGNYNLTYSPRNHIYDLIIDRSYEKIKITESPNVYIKIIDENGSTVYNGGNMYTSKIQPGNYKLYVFASRDYTGKYEIKFYEKIKSIIKIEFKKEKLENQSFDIQEGGSGFVYTMVFSPRNPVYEFEINRDELFDIDIRSDGIKMAAYIISPVGTKINPEQFSENGKIYFSQKAESSGAYKLYLNTLKENDRGKYTIESTGNFTKFPTLKTSQKEKIEDGWSKKAVSSYKINYNEGSQEIMIRSKSGKIDLNLNSEVFSNYNTNYNMNEPGLKNIVFNVKTPGVYNLNIITENSEGSYELYFWGNIEKIEKKENLKFEGTIIKPLNSYNNFTINLLNITQNINKKINTDYNSVNFKLELERDNVFEVEILGDNIFSDIKKLDLIKEPNSPDKFKIKYVDIKQGVKLNFVESYFEKDKIELSELGKKELERIANKLIEQSRKIQIDISSFEKQNTTLNMTLSKERAQTIKKYLSSLELPNDRFMFKFSQNLNADKTSFSSVTITII